MADIKTIFGAIDHLDTYQRVNSTHLLDLYVGIDAAARWTLLLISEYPPMKVTSSRMILVKSGRRPDKKWSLSFSLIDDSYSDMFVLFCEDMVTFVNLFLVAYSDTAIAFFGAYFKVQQLIVMTVNGLIQGCLPVMRFNYGAGNSERLHSAFRYGIALVTGMMILGMLAVILFPAQILGLFTASEAMRSFGISAMRIMATSYLFCGLSTMISTYFQATEKVGSSMAIQLCRQLLFLIPSLWCLDKWFHLNGIWLAFPVAETGTLLVALIMMAWYHRKKIIACSAKEEL